jgi:hypothetical protein
MTSINTLVEDMNRVLTPSEEGGVADVVLGNFAERITGHVRDTLELRETRQREPKVLYASEVGESCIRKLRYRLSNQAQEDIPPHTHFKFLYGDVLEEVSLLLAEAAGHVVTNPQMKVSVKVGDWEVRGRQDAEIDGVPIDVKSMSTYGFNALSDDLDLYEDSWGYVDQVSFYRNFGPSENEHVGILGIDKTLGHIKLSIGSGKDKATQSQQIQTIIETLDRDGDPTRGYAEVPEGSSGNMRLGFQCSYCPFKQQCWADSNDGAGLRTFIYAKGPVYYTDVVRLPRVPEVSYA